MAWRLAGHQTPLIWSWWGNVNTNCICQVGDGKSAPFSACQYQHWCLWAGSWGRGSVSFLKDRALQTNVSVLGSFSQKLGHCYFLLGWKQKSEINLSTNYQIVEKMYLIWTKIRLQYSHCLHAIKCNKLEYIKLQD